MTNICVKLYSGHLLDFYRDHRRLIESLWYFRSNCRGRYGKIPEIVQERLLGKLIARCQEAVIKNAIERAYIPGYLGKALSRFVDEIAEQMREREKRNQEQNQRLEKLHPEIIKAILEAAFARTIAQKLEEI